MVTRAKKRDDVRNNKKIKVLSLKKETVKNLTRNEASGIKGGTGVCLSGRASARSILSSVGHSVSGGFGTSDSQINTSLRGSI